MLHQEAAAQSGVGLSRRWLQGAGVVWFVAAAIGQAAFIIFILGYYGPRTVLGDYPAWNDKGLIDGYIAGDGIGNFVFIAHVLLASVVTLCGLMQLVPAIRQKSPWAHRWSGRIFLSLSLVMAISGVWLTLVRGTFLSTVSSVAILLDAVLILVFAVLAWRYALARRFDVHKRWAMRTFMVVSGVWFLRVGLMAWAILTRGAGMDGTLSGPADTVIVFGSYLIPLAILEAYFWAQRSRSGVVRGGVTALVLVSAAYTALGSAGAIFLMWGPEL